MKIVLGTDLSEEALGAAKWAFGLAGSLRAQKRPYELTLMHVTMGPKWGASVQATFEDPDNQFRLEKMIKDWLEPHVDASLDYTIIYAEGNPVKELRDWSKAHHADWLVVGMTGHGAFARMMVGSTAHRLAQRPPCKMAVIHPEHALLNKSARFLVGIDFLDSSLEALATAAEHARVLDASLHIVHVVNAIRAVALPNGLIGYSGGPTEMVELEAGARRDLAELVEANAELLQGVPHTHEVLSGHPTRALIDHAKEQDFDAICLGTVGRSVLDDFMLGSVASGVLRHMPTTILLSPPPKNSAQQR
ncbi:MAG: universal stress protein [Bradymonadaceae bacterium]|nr:universal stress protein [Lujinxingiaceae bacterium]